MRTRCTKIRDALGWKQEVSDCEGRFQLKKQRLCKVIGNVPGHWESWWQNQGWYFSFLEPSSYLFLPAHPAVQETRIRGHTFMWIIVDAKAKSISTQTEFFQLKTFTLKVRVILKYQLVPRVSSTIKLDVFSIAKPFSIAKESYEIVPGTIVNHNMVLCGLRAFFYKGEKF